MTAAQQSVRDRILTSIMGTAAVMVAVPVILSLWTPVWFVVAWGAGYLVATAVFLTYLLRRTDDPRTELVWSYVLAFFYASVPLATLIFEPTIEAVLATGVLTAVFLANEVAARDWLETGDWRIPPVIVATATVVSAAVHVNPLLAIGFALAVVMVVQNAQAVRDEEAEIRYERNHDELTGLLNRRGLLDELEQIQGDLTMVMIDADRFKTVNDTYGYAAGDSILRAAATALTERLGEDWVLARQGGDEFVAISPGHVDVRTSIVDPVAFTFPFRGQPLEVKLELSAGQAQGTADAGHEQLMSRAAFSLQTAKRSRDISLSRFDSSLEQRFTQALEVGAAKDLPAIDALFAVAQPITDGSSVIGWELLARWRGHDDSVMEPAELLPLLAENGLMPQLNDGMLAMGIEFAARFNNRVAAPFVAVNVSASHLANGDLVRRVSELLSAHRVAPARLMIEITESEGLDALTEWKSTARGLIELGVKLAIDDFGTGYSNIERSRQMPITHLKLDGSFASALNGPFGEVIRGVVRFARKTGLGIVAEGIETIDQYDSMHSLGVEYFQGYYFARPMSLDDAERALLANPAGRNETDAPKRL